MDALVVILNEIKNRKQHSFGVRGEEFYFGHVSFGVPEVHLDI